jgi:hypothetical protein
MQESEFLSALLASQGNVDLTRENELFGQFVGGWEFDWYGYEKNMEAQHEKGEWIFSEITRDSFNWRSIVSRDEGNTWDLVQKMIVKRKEVNA